MKRPRPPLPRSSGSAASPFAARGGLMQDASGPFLVTALLVGTQLLSVDSVSVQFGYGLPMVTLSLVLLLAALAANWLTSQRPPRLGPTAWWVAALLLWQLAGTLLLVLGERGNARFAVNLFWQWVGFGVTFLLVRLLVRGTAATRALCAVMLAVAVSQSTFGLYQHFVSKPAQWKSYQQASQAERRAMLQAAGIEVTEGEPELNQFENRLRDYEPTASFALSNSLAGFLAPWMIVALGIAAQGLSRQPPRVVCALLSGVVLIGVCLLLTKSRTGYVAVGVGVIVLLLARWRTGQRFGWKLPLLASALLVGLLTVLFFTRALDYLLVTQAVKSMAFRLEYWRATLAMIADHPWFGCGLGNFQNAYTAYKLPQASETVADPHNFLLEIAATAGIPAAVAFVGVTLAFLYQYWRMPPEQVERQPAGSARLIATYAGVAAGMVAALAAGLSMGLIPEPTSLVITLLVAGVWLWLMHPWTAGGTLAAAPLVVAAGVELVGLLGAGGISFPGVAQTWWVLLALVVNQAEGVPQSHAAVPRPAVWALVIAALLAVAAAYYTAYWPVVQCEMRLAEGDRLQAIQQRDGAEASYHEATAADPRSPLPWFRLAALNYAAWSAGDNPSRLEQCFAAAERAVARDPRSHQARRIVGDWYLGAYRRSGSPQLIDNAIRSYDEAVRLYPNSGFLHAQLAWALQLAGRDSRARREAETALQLDALNPHVEQKLAQRYLSGTTGEGEGGQRLTAEQLMLQMRNGSEVP